MKSKVTRRSFLGASLAATTASAVIGHPAGLASLLAGPNASSKVFAVLQKHLGLTEEHREVAEAFTRSLQSSYCHHESPTQFSAKLAGLPTSGEPLALYILQEFVISTNYTSFVKGATRHLQLKTVTSLTAELA